MADNKSQNTVAINYYLPDSPDYLPGPKTDIVVTITQAGSIQENFSTKGSIFARATTINSLAYSVATGRYKIETDLEARFGPLAINGDTFDNLGAKFSYGALVAKASLDGSVSLGLGANIKGNGGSVSLEASELGNIINIPYNVIQGIKYIGGAIMGTERFIDDSFKAGSNPLFSGLMLGASGIDYGTTGSIAKDRQFARDYNKKLPGSHATKLKVIETPETNQSHIVEVPKNPIERAVGAVGEAIETVLGGVAKAVGAVIGGIANAIGSIFSSNNNDDSDGESSGKPIIIDLDGDGIEVAPKDQNFTLFDFDDDGFKECTAWVGADDGLLMFDLNGDGEITTAREIAFAQWVAEGDEDLTDMEALAAFFDVNQDGVLDQNDVSFAADHELVTRGLVNAGDSVWNSFKIWQDLDSDGEIDTDELKTLAEWNITSFTLNYSHDQAYALNDGSVINGFFDVNFTHDDASTETRLAGDVSLAYTTFGLKETEDADGNKVITFEDGDEAINRILKSADDVDFDVNNVEHVDFDLGDDDTDWQAATGNAADNTINASLKTTDIQLKGGDGNDSLTGGSGNDVLIGEGGIDTLDGGAGDDLLVVDQDDDFDNMSGGISGGAGYDTLIFQGEGALNINLDALGIESATGGDGNDIIDGDNSNLSIYSDYASFDEDGNAVGGDVQIGYHMDGGKGDDTLDGANNDDRLIGGEGADTLWGQGGNDQLVGGADNDTLNGGSGNDSYFYTRGDGDDTITDIGGDTDVLALSDVELSDLELASVNGDLVITIMDREADLADGTITIENWTHEHQRIEYLQLSDGTVVEIGNLKIDGANTREQRNDIAAYYYNLDASQSPDHLGDVDWSVDVTEFETLDEINFVNSADSFWEDGQSDHFAAYYTVDVDVLESDDFTFSMSFEGFAMIFVDGELLINGNGDFSYQTMTEDMQLDLGEHKVEVYYLNKTGNAGLELNWQKGNEAAQNIGFSATQTPVWKNGTAVAATIIGNTGNDYLMGGTGDEVLKGFWGHDYLQGGDGTDTIWGGHGDDSLDAGKGDLAERQSLFGEYGDDVYTVSKDNGNVYISEAASAGFDSVIFSDLNLSDLTIEYVDAPETFNQLLRFSWDVGTADEGKLEISNSGRNIELFVFKDNTSISTVEINDHLGLTIRGSDGNDRITGSSLTSDNILGGYGDDLLSAGGTEQDGVVQTLNGQIGNDTYLYSKRDGIVEIVGETANQGANDRVIFDDLLLEDLTVEFVTIDGKEMLKFSWADVDEGTSGELRVPYDGENIERFVFADGSSFAKVEFDDQGRLVLHAERQQSQNTSDLFNLVNLTDLYKEHMFADSSSRQSNSYLAENTLDDDTGTVFQSSGGGSSQWYELDLGAELDVSIIEISASLSGTAYSLNGAKVSLLDNEGQIIQVRDGNGDLANYFDPIDGAYFGKVLRFAYDGEDAVRTVRVVAGSNDIAIAEINVYGEDVAPDTFNLVNLTDLYKEHMFADSSSRQSNSYLAENTLDDDTGTVFQSSGG
ncbi:hypothetical protein AB2J24_19460, partial [Lentilitoribacter sp. EG35]